MYSATMWAPPTTSTTTTSARSVSPVRPLAVVSMQQRGAFLNEWRACVRLELLNTSLEIHICWKVESDDRIDPPIHTEYLRSGARRP